MNAVIDLLSLLWMAIGLVLFAVVAQ